MATLTIRDPYGNTFEIDASARSFWEHRDGYTILPGDEPEAPAEPTQTGKKAASRPASEDKE
ncbi:hypothetical protein ABT294_00580 [Nonomuraea sp. NPDC000554]|uniref:hypothetical protein n=1 Tax=Nonomuraea sp. NPDC000554 TaxID=3154259 RepID=UPI00331B3D1B